MKLTPAKIKRLVEAATDKKGVSQVFRSESATDGGCKSYYRKKAPDCTEEKK